MLTDRKEQLLKFCGDHPASELSLRASCQQANCRGSFLFKDIKDRCVQWH